MNVKDAIKRSVLEILILSLLSGEDMYGYQLTKEMEQRSDGELVIPAGALYPVLYRLIDGGYITDHQEPAGKRRLRVYYHLEEKGEAYLDTLLADYKCVSNSIDIILSSNK